MEGGIAILLLLILAAVAAAWVFGLFGAGGALSLRRRAEAKGDSAERPTHTHPTTPYHENTTFVGSEDAADGSGTPDRPQAR